MYEMCYTNKLALPCLALPCLALPCLALPCIQYRQTNQSHLGIWSQAFSTPWVLSSAGKLIRSDIYMGPTSCIIVPQMFSSLIFYPSSLSFCRSAQLFTECSLSSMSRVDTPLTADWLHICFGTLPRLSFLKRFWKMTNPTFNKY